MGEISDIKLVVERSTGRSRAFALITMATPEGAEAALQSLHRHSLNGRYITVNIWPKEEDNSFPKGGIAFEPEEPSISQSEMKSRG
jgi:RNA recognition motif-containing protein